MTKKKNMSRKSWAAFSIPASYALLSNASHIAHQKQNLGARASSFLEAIADAIKGLDHLEIVIHDLEFLAQALDVAVNRAVVDIDLIIIGRIHQGVAALDDSGPRCESLEDQEFGDSQGHLVILPGAGVPFRVHLQKTAFEDFRLGLLSAAWFLGIGSAQNGLNTLDEKALRKGFADEIVGAHLEPEQFIDFLILRGEEDHRHVGLLTEPAEQFHAVHSRHLYIENRKIGRIALQIVERRRTIRISLDAIAFSLEGNRHGGKDISVVVNQGNRWHEWS